MQLIVKINVKMFHLLKNLLLLSLNWTQEK